jgi:hypothetical protein
VTQPGIHIAAIIRFPQAPADQRDVLDRTRAQCALYSLLTGDPDAAQEHLDAMLPEALQDLHHYAYILADMAQTTFMDRPPDQGDTP